jgi:hypothetical protein
LHARGGAAKCLWLEPRNWVTGRRLSTLRCTTEPWALRGEITGGWLRTIRSRAVWGNFSCSRRAADMGHVRGEREVLTELDRRQGEAIPFMDIQP